MAGLLETRFFVFGFGVWRSGFFGCCELLRHRHPKNVDSDPGWGKRNPGSKRLELSQLIYPLMLGQTRCLADLGFAIASGFQFIQGPKHERQTCKAETSAETTAWLCLGAQCTHSDCRCETNKHLCSLCKWTWIELWNCLEILCTYVYLSVCLPSACLGFRTSFGMSGTTIKIHIYIICIYVYMYVCMYVVCMYAYTVWLLSRRTIEQQVL